MQNCIFWNMWTKYLELLLITLSSNSSIMNFFFFTLALTRIWNLIMGLNIWKSFFSHGHFQWSRKINPINPQDIPISEDKSVIIILLALVFLADSVSCYHIGIQLLVCSPVWWLWICELNIFLHLLIYWLWTQCCLTSTVSQSVAYKRNPVCIQDW